MPTDLSLEEMSEDARFIPRYGWMYPVAIGHGIEYLAYAGFNGEQHFFFRQTESGIRRYATDKWDGEGGVPIRVSQGTRVIKVEHNGMFLPGSPQAEFAKQLLDRAMK